MTGSEAVAEKPSLYDRLGGVYSIATVVEDLTDRIMVDPRLNANPRVDEAHHKVPPAGFKYLVTEMLCEKTTICTFAQHRRLARARTARHLRKEKQIYRRDVFWFEL
jgi:hypothetical protein